MSAFAFFDADGTLLSRRTMFEFEESWLLEAERRDPSGYAAWARKRRRRELRSLAARPREEANRAFYRGFAGRRAEAVREHAERWVARVRASSEPYFLQGGRALLESLRARGIEPVIVSGSFHDVLEPFARELGVRSVLATRLEVQDLILTGRTLGPTLIGDGKRVAVREFMQRHRVRPADCHACGDHVSDAAMLEAVGHGWVLPGDSELEALAALRGWSILREGGAA